MKNQTFARGLAAVFTVAAALLTLPLHALAQSAENVAVVINDNSPDSQRVGQAYASARSIPDSNIFHLRTALTENVDRAIYNQTIEGPLLQAILRARLQDRILYLVLTKGVPLRVDGTTGKDATIASVDSELTLLYRRMTGQIIRPEAAVVNPYFLGDWELAEARPFSRRAFDIFLVSRLDGFTVDEVLALIERGVTQEGRPSRARPAGCSRRSNRRHVAGARVEEPGRAGPRRGCRLGADAQARAHRHRRPGRPPWGSTDPQNRTRTSGMAMRQARLLPRS